MQRIASFSVNHDLLEKGVYVSRVDGDVVTYDVRMKKPNQGDYLPTGGMHSLEHLFATYARNSAYTDSVIYVGPMGCRTGFYLLMRDTVSKEEVIQLIRDSMDYVVHFEGEMPGGKREECGNYLDHNVEEAKKVAADMLSVLKEWTAEDMKYRE